MRNVIFLPISSESKNSSMEIYFAKSQNVPIYIIFKYKFKKLQNVIFLPISVQRSSPRDVVKVHLLINVRRLEREAVRVDQIALDLPTSALMKIPIEHIILDTHCTLNLLPFLDPLHDGPQLAVLATLVVHGPVEGHVRAAEIVPAVPDVGHALPRLKETLVQISSAVR